MIEASRPTISLMVDHPSMVGEARRRTAALADRLGFDETRRGTAALVVTEAASNLSKHAGQGELILQGWTGRGGVGRLEILAVDRGPGMSDVGRCLVDGYSTAGSPGTGLGAISRLADDFAIHSASGAGTVLWAGVDAGPATSAPGRSIELGVVSVPAPGEEACGDEWAVLDREGMSFILVADGLGHGPAAAEAAAEAVAVFRDSRSSEPGEIIEAAHAALRGTRGAALSIARLDPRRNQARYAGVGNIAGAIVAPRSGHVTRIVSMNGTVGHAIHKIQSFDYDWPEGGQVILHSDGLGTRWDRRSYPGVSPHAPGLLAGLLYRDHRRGRDDVTVIVGTMKEASS